MQFEHWCNPLILWYPTKAKHILRYLSLWRKRTSPVSIQGEGQCPDIWPVVVKVWVQKCPFRSVSNCPYLLEWILRRLILFRITCTLSLSLSSFSILNFLTMSFALKTCMTRNQFVLDPSSNRMFWSFRYVSSKNCPRRKMLFLYFFLFFNNSQSFLQFEVTLGHLMFLGLWNLSGSLVNLVPAETAYLLTVIVH